MIRYMKAGDKISDIPKWKWWTAPAEGYYDVGPMHVVRIGTSYIKHLDEAPPMFDYDDYPGKNYAPTPTLKCKCWVCAREFTPSQYYDFSTGKNRITLSHCDRTQTIELTDKQIEENNNSGFYYAFML